MSGHINMDKINECQMKYLANNYLKKSYIKFIRCDLIEDYPNLELNDYLGQMEQIIINHVWYKIRNPPLEFYEELTGIDKIIYELEKTTNDDGLDLLESYLDKLTEGIRYTYLMSIKKTGYYNSLKNINPRDTKLYFEIPELNKEPLDEFQIEEEEESSDDEYWY